MLHLFFCMLDIKFIRENPKQVEENLKKRFQKEKILILNDLLNKDEEKRKLLQQSQQLRQKRNELSQEINKLKKEGKDISKLLKEASSIPQKIKDIEAKQEKIDNQIRESLLAIPNLIRKSVPLGKDATKNKVIKKFGKPLKLSFKPKNHVELMESLQLGDFDASARVSGNGFYFLKGDLALLNQALIRFTIDFMQKKGYTYIEPPLMLRKNILAASTDMETLQDSIYDVNDTDLSLIGTSEYSLLAMHANEAIKEEDLPKKYFSYTMCFRKEIGSHGINEKGLWRTHQFNKVEQFIFCTSEDSDKYYEELLKNSEEIYKALKIPYRILEFCSGDLSSWKAKSCDIEAYRPTTKGYEEVGSLTNCTDYQARKLNIKVVRKNNEREILHTLNNTAIATSRALVAILENYQNKDGSITIPSVLVKYMNGKKKIKAC